MLSDTAASVGESCHGDGDGRDRPTPRGAIARRTACPPSVLATDAETRQNRELAAGHRMVSVKGSGGVAATVIVTVQRGTVWLSIRPPFTWEAIMNPAKVDELMQILADAQEDATKEGYHR